MNADVTRTRIIYGCVVALYVLCFPYHPKLRSPNELCRLHQTRALVEYGTLDINQAIRDFGSVGDLSVKDGRYYPSKAPLLSFAAVPVYAVMRLLGGGYLYAVKEVPLVYWARFFCTVLPTLLMLIPLRRFLRTLLAPNVANSLVVTYALGSLAFSYSLLFMSHQTTAVLLFLSFYALWRTFRQEWKAWSGFVCAGFFAGLAVAAEYTAGLGVIGLAAFFIAAKVDAKDSGSKRLKSALRSAAMVALGALPPLVLLGAYHSAIFGHPFETGYRHLADAGYQPWHLGGFLGIRTPDPRAWVLSFFSPLRGLFSLSPFLFLAVPGLVFQFRQTDQRPLFWLSASLALAYAYFTSSFSYESWGWTTGPRHMTGLVPFLLLPVGIGFERIRSSWGRGLAAGLCAASIVITGALTFINYIPDDVSEPLFGFALPIFRDGYRVPTALSALGAPSSLVATLLGLLLLTAATGVVFLLQTERQLSYAVGVSSALILAIAFHASTVRHDDHDAAATRFLEASWFIR